MQPNFLNPSEIINSLIETSQTKLRLSWRKMILLGILAGAYLGFGEQLLIVVNTGSTAVVGSDLSKL